MAGHTLSTYADDQTYQKATRLAKLEDRSTAQVVGAALRLYLRLPPWAHDALRRLEASGPEQVDAAALAAARALLSQEYEAAVAASLAEATPLARPGEDEDSLFAKAVDLTSQPRR